MKKRFDALYGEMIEDPLTKEDSFEIKDRTDSSQLVRVLKMRAEGYLAKAEEFDKVGKGAQADTYEAICRELVYLSKEIAAGNLDKLEAKGEGKE